MRDNPVQFAVVREDPTVELEVLRDTDPKSILMIGSGGCTALSLQHALPNTRFTLVEPNPSQIEIIKQKMVALSESSPGSRHQAFNIAKNGDLDVDKAMGLSNSGNFESLFRGLREFIFDFILPHEQMRELFEENGKLSLADVDQHLFKNPYWPIGFQLFLSDPILNTMFGPDATQHAEPGSYPGYFQALFERGLTQADAIDNYFLHHVLLGYYLDRPQALPLFLNHDAPEFHFEFSPNLMGDVEGLDQYDLVGLSNICDWMATEDVEQLAQKLAKEMKSGSIILYRQLNNERDIEGMLGDVFTFDAQRNQDIHANDRSLFYSSIHAGIRR